MQDGWSAVPWATLFSVWFWEPLTRGLFVGHIPAVVSRCDSAAGPSRLRGRRPPARRRAGGRPPRDGAAPPPCGPPVVCAARGVSSSSRPIIVGATLSGLSTSKEPQEERAPGPLECSLRVWPPLCPQISRTQHLLWLLYFETMFFPHMKQHGWFLFLCLEELSRPKKSPLFYLRKSSGREGIPTALRSRKTPVAFFWLNPSPSP